MSEDELQEEKDVDIPKGETPVSPFVEEVKNDVKKLVIKAVLLIAVVFIIGFVLGAVIY